jgi:hypothetical protein
MERHDEKPRAYPEQEAGRRGEGTPEEGAAAADAARDYTDTGRTRTEADHDYVDPSGEYSEAGRDESVESERSSETQPGQDREPGRADSAASTATPVESGSEEGRANASGETATATSRPGTHEATADNRGEGQAFRGTAGSTAGTAMAGTETAYDAATERKAVTPPDAESRATGAGAAAAATAEGTRGDQAAADGTQATPGAVNVGEQTAVLSREDAQTFQVRWETIQGTFIDDPHAATEQADALVGEVMDQLARLREDYLRQLRSALSDGSDTEAMRVALTRYRAFFQMLLG